MVASASTKDDFLKIPLALQTSVIRSDNNQKINIQHKRTFRTEKLPDAHARYFKRPEERLKSRSWASVARKINVSGGRRRHEFYRSSADKQVRRNTPLHGMLRLPRSTKWTGQTVEVLRTPHIKLKTSAKCSPANL